jgi:lipid II:glycine glycyltransferase (peptidoglycan interpeptide bridge formation enzyme)
MSKELLRYAANESQIARAVAIDPGPEAAATEWDQFVAATHGGDVVQTSAWAQAKQGLGLEFCIVPVRSGADIVGGAQILIKRFGPFGGIGYVSRGPLLSSEDRRHAPWMLDEIERAARAKRVRHLIVQPPEGGESIAAELAARGYMPDAPEVAPTASMRLDLSINLSQLLAQMSASRRKEVRRGQRGNLEISYGDRSDLDLFHALYQATARRQGFTSVSRRYLQLHWDALYLRGFALLVFACHSGSALAGLWLTAFRDTVTERLAGWNFEGRHLHPTVGCRWAAIQWAKEHGYRYYDFGGIDRRHAELLLAGLPLPEVFHRTPDAFKREFGPAPVLFPVASQQTLSPLVRPIVQYLHARTARSEALRKLVHRMRNG